MKYRISSSRYAELYKVPMRTSSRELGELARKGVFVLVGQGRQSRYELNSNRARIAPITPNFGKGLRVEENGQNAGENAILCRRGSVKSVDKSVDKTSEDVFNILKINPRITLDQVAKEIGLSVRGVEQAVKRLRIAKRIKKVGGKKLGHWEVTQTIVQGT